MGINYVFTDGDVQVGTFEADEKVKIHVIIIRGLYRFEICTPWYYNMVRYGKNLFAEFPFKTDSTDGGIHLARPSLFSFYD